MGYTHYWSRNRKLSAEEMGDICSVVRKIIAEADCDIVNGHGEEDTKPKLTKEMISFNGREENGHETFLIHPDPGSDFCKTAYKPYDKVVVACLTLMAAKYDWSVSSDGDAPDWEEGVELLEKVTGQQFANPLIVREMVR